MENCMNNNKILLYAITIGATFNTIHSIKKSYEETYFINWPYNSKIYHYCYSQRYRKHSIDTDCSLMHNYIVARANAGKILNYKKSQEQKLKQINDDLAAIETSKKDNFLIELKLEAHKKILLEEHVTITTKLSSIPAIEEKMSDEDYYNNIIKTLMSKANIISDEDAENELNIMLKILQNADEAKFTDILAYEMNYQKM
jgi:hypothetical protein